jgi:hypothetical protein
MLYEEHNSEWDQTARSECGPDGDCKEWWLNPAPGQSGSPETYSECGTRKRSVQGSPYVASVDGYAYGYVQECDRYQEQGADWNGPFGQPAECNYGARFSHE